MGGGLPTADLYFYRTYTITDCVPDCISFIDFEERRWKSWFARFTSENSPTKTLTSRKRRRPNENENARASGDAGASLGSGRMSRPHRRLDLNRQLRARRCSARRQRDHVRSSQGELRSDGGPGRRPRPHIQ